MANADMMVVKVVVLKRIMTLGIESRTSHNLMRDNLHRCGRRISEVFTRGAEPFDPKLVLAVLRGSGTLRQARTTNYETVQANCHWSG